jgi:pyruvate dehydrogenase E1 component beta subunit
MAIMTYSQAIREALREEMKRDDSVFIFGEDVGVFNGPYGVTNGLLEEFGGKRVWDTPISEAAIMGLAVGSSMTGMRPVAEIMYMDFITCCMDELVNQAAKIKYMTGGKIKLPLTVRMAIGAGFSAAAQHSQSLEALLAHIPGLKIVMPSTPYDAKGLLKSAIRDDDPVIFLEHKKLYDGLQGEVPEEDYLISLGSADVKREGQDVTIIATSDMVHKAIVAAETLSEEGIDVEVIDLRCLVPLDKKTILESVMKTNKVVITEEAVKRNGFSANVAAMIIDEAFEYLDAPIKRVCSMNTPVPFSPVLEAEYLPNTENICQAVRTIA